MKRFLIALVAVFSAVPLFAQENVIDEIVWVVGDDAILKSDVESQRLYMQNEGQRFDGDPYCIIPEQLAVQKLYLTQAKLDSITANEASVLQSVNQWMNFAVNQIGDRDKLEEYFGKKYSAIKSERQEMIEEQQIVQELQRTLIGEIKLTPSEVRTFYNGISKDSLPTIPTKVEVEIVTVQPNIPFEETDAIKSRLRDFTEQVNTGKMEFSTLARLYSEDTESAKRGGELGFMGKGQLLPEFANVAFNMSDPKRVSQIVQTEYGYHIIQLIEKRGDRINVRHILLRPKVSDKVMEEATAKLDTIRQNIEKDKYSFEEAASYLSADKDTRNNKGLMVNQSMESNDYSTPKFEMQELPQEIGKVVDKMQVGDVSTPFTMLTSKQQEVVAIVKLKSRTEGHLANLVDDYQSIKTMVESQKKAQLLDDWIREKQKTTYVRIADGWQNCDFKYPGWAKK